MHEEKNGFVKKKCARAAEKKDASIKPYLEQGYDVNLLNAVSQKSI